MHMSCAEDKAGVQVPPGLPSGPLLQELPAHLLGGFLVILLLLCDPPAPQ